MWKKNVLAIDNIDKSNKNYWKIIHKRSRTKLISFTFTSHSINIDGVQLIHEEKNRGNKNVKWEEIF